MSILIKGMEMPKSCGNCYMFSFLSDSCRITNHVTEEMNDKMFDRRFDDCPLVPVPKHGRLVDADVLTELCRDIQSIEWNKHTAPYSWEYAYEDFENVILNAPTIIPPEETNKEATNDQNNS